MKSTGTNIHDISTLNWHYVYVTTVTCNTSVWLVLYWCMNMYSMYITVITWIVNSEMKHTQLWTQLFYMSTFCFKTITILRCLYSTICYSPVYLFQPMLPGSLSAYLQACHLCLAVIPSLAMPCHLFWERDNDKRNVLAALLLVSLEWPRQTKVLQCCFTCLDAQSCLRKKKSGKCTELDY